MELFIGKEMAIDGLDLQELMLMFCLETNIRTSILITSTIIHTRKKIKIQRKINNKKT